jgi:hypothetical protein
MYQVEGLKMNAGVRAVGKRTVLLPSLTLAGSERRFQPGETETECVLSGPRANPVPMTQSRIKHTTTRRVVQGDGASSMMSFSDVLKQQSRRESTTQRPRAHWPVQGVFMPESTPAE